jgi:hypothetical protein
VARIKLSKIGRAAPSGVVRGRAARRAKGAARLLGVNEATSRRWARFGVTGTAEIVLRLLAAGFITVGDIEAVR